jgi:sulfur-oxidizing protein SoxX
MTRRIVLALACAAVAAAALPAVGETLSGAELFTRADQGHCVACHEVASAAPSARRSDVGPKLEGARMRALGRERLRALLTDPMASNPETLMPPYGRHRILDAAEIERVIDYLYALP